jgi:predicted nucleic-acid-binding Zn-ribbon protein
MPILYLTCKRCGSEFWTDQSSSREALAAVELPARPRTCSECGATVVYAKEDYHLLPREPAPGPPTGP